MASILRSGKFVRYFAGLTRSILVNTAYKTEGNLVQNQQCVCSIISHGFGTAAPKSDQNLDRSLRRLDQDVRRIGRISRRDIEEVLEEIRNQRSATSSQSLLVIRCCGNLVPDESPEVRTQLVKEIWKTLNALNVPMDISHYNALLRVYLENEHQFSPTEFLTDIEAKGVEPNRVTYQRLISRYCQKGDIEGATRILEFMKDKQLPVNEHVFNSLILGHSQANDLESAAGILSVMKQAGLEPSADTYTTLLCCYGRHGDLDAIMKTLDECEKNEVYLLDKDILDVIYSLTINGHGDKIDPLFGKIRKSVGYNQDAVNTILRLTNKGYEDVAFKILQTMTRASKTDGELAETGSFFIRQLVKANRPIEKIIKICNELREKNLNAKSLLIATEASLINGLTNIAYPLLKELKTNGLPVRQHFFWPLICSVGPDEILNILRNMNEEFGILPNSETIRDYVIPNLKEKNSEKIITLLQTTGISTATATSSIVYNAIISNKLKEAADIASTTSAFYNPSLFRRPLIQALGKTKDFESYIKLVRQICDGLSRSSNLQQNQQQDEEDSDHSLSSTQQYNQGEVLGQIVYDAVIYFKTNRAEMLEKILSGLVEQGLSISNVQAERIQERIGSEMNENLSKLLEKLSAGDLEPLPIERPERSRRSSFETMSVEQLEKFIEAQEAKNENTKGLKRYLLNSCFKSKDLEKTEEVLKKLEAEDYVLTSGVYAQLIDLYCHHNKLDEALKTYEKMKLKEPDFVLDNLKTIKVVDLLIKDNRIDDAVKFLDANHKENKIQEENSFNYNTICWRVLNSLGEKGNVEDLKKIFEALESKNYITVNNVLLGPLVKVHIVNNDLKSAIDTFEEICNKYQATPWKNELACRLIQAEDATNLQRLTDLSTNIHGEVNSLYDLVFSFVECRRIRQARKILETPGLRNRPQRINSACERYRQEGMVESLEGLVEATKDLNHIDRSDIYYNLLLTYCKEDQPDKALGLWTKMQEDDITPSDMFLIKLAEFLKEKNMEVPFVIPSTIPPERETTKKVEKKSKATTSSVSTIDSLQGPLQDFKKALKSNDIDKALSLKQKFASDVKLSITDQSLLIEGLLKTDRISEATKIVKELLDQNLHPLTRIFKFYLNKLAISGDIKTMEEIENKIDPELKKVLSFDNRCCNAHMVSGKIESYLNKLSEELEKAETDDEIKSVIEKFPRGGALGILEKHPEFCDKFTQLAEKYLAKGSIGPINILWIYYFLHGNDAKCKEIFDQHLESSPRIMFQRILQTSRENQDEQLIQKLISYLKRSKITEGAMGNAYSCYIDILTTKDKYEEALELLKKAIDDICLENFNKTALLRLKNGLEMRGKTFPYQIPERNIRNADTSSSSTSSSSSSDDDVKVPVPETKPVEPEKPKN